MSRAYAWNIKGFRDRETSLWFPELQLSRINVNQCDCCSVVFLYLLYNVIMGLCHPDCQLPFFGSCLLSNLLLYLLILSTQSVLFGFLFFFG